MNQNFYHTPIFKMKDLDIHTSIFPLVKRFKNIKSANTTFVLKEDTSIYTKFFREGTIFSVIGWKDIHNKEFLILSKGSWEGLVEVKFITDKLNAI